MGDMLLFLFSRSCSIHFSWIHFFGNSKTRYYIWDYFLHLGQEQVVQVICNSLVDYDLDHTWYTLTKLSNLEMEIIWCWSSASDSCVEWISFSRWKWLVTFWRIVIFLICTTIHWSVQIFSLLLSLTCPLKGDFSARKYADALKLTATCLTRSWP